MKEINNIKSTLGQYEKILLDKETIKNTCISTELKEKIYQDLQLRSNEVKNKLIEMVKNLPAITEIVISCVAEETQENTSNKTDYKIWKESILSKVNFIYDRILNYISGKEIFHEIYEKMTNVYGIVWEQDFKEWRRDNVGVPRTLNIIYNNSQYKSIFESILDGKYDEAYDYDPLTIKEIIEPLIKLNKDRSNGGCITLKKIYQRMEIEYNVNWDKWTRKYEKENGIVLKSKADLLYWKHGLMERFRQVVSLMIQEAK